LTSPNAVAAFRLPSDGRAPRVLAGGYGDLPLAFDANAGQTDPQVKYLARGRGYSLFLTASEAVIRLKPHHTSGVQEALHRRTTGLPLVRGGRKKAAPRRPALSPGRAVVRMAMIGANPEARISASGQLPGKTNYFVGRDPAKWRTNVPQYSRIEYADIYPGVNLAYHGRGQQLEFDYVISPGADAGRIAMGFSGVEGLATDESGDLIVSSAGGDIRMQRPVAYQESRGAREPVQARFRVEQGSRVQFELGSYDRSRELVIDPALRYSTYLGGGGEDEGFGIAVDSSGAAYVTGETDSPDFPGTVSATNGGSFDGFVTKLNPSGSAVVYTTLIGGSGDDAGAAVAVDSLGDVYATGITESNDLPVTVGVLQSVFGGGLCASGTRNCNDAYVAKLNSSGGISYLTYLGGSGDDSPIAIAIDSAGDAYVAGQTFSAPFPGTLSSSIQQVFNLGESNTASDGFLAELNPTATALVYSTYLGGGDNDLIYGLAVDSVGAAYVAGDTVSTDFPITAGAFQTQCGTDGACDGGNDDAFAAKVTPGGTALSYSTYMGGSGVDIAFSLAIDSSGAAYLTGFTSSGADFPLQGPFQAELLSSNGSAFVAKLNPSGSALNYSSYLGGSVFEAATGIAVDQLRNAYLTGTTQSIDFPGADALQPLLNGNSDAFITEVNNTGQTKVYSTFLGGSGDENFDASSGTPFGGYIAVVTTSGAAFVTGTTFSTDFPTAAALQSAAPGGTDDAFVAKISPAPTGPDFSVGVDPATVVVASGQTTADMNVTVTPLNGNFGSAVALTCGSLPTDATCNFSKSSVTPGGSQARVTLSISTAATTMRGHAARPGHRAHWLYAMLLPMAGMAFLFSASQKKRLRATMLALLVMTGLMFLASCGDNGGGGGGNQGGGTPSGNYQIAVTGTSGSDVHTANIVLSVQ